MKVHQPGPGTPAERSRRTQKSTHSHDAEAFKQHIAEGSVSMAGGPTAAGPLAALGSLLSVQEVPDPLAERKRAVMHGDTLLDELKELQIGLVQGWVSEDMLRNIAEMLDRPRPTIDDPDLNAVLDEIEVRAAVELAKLDRGSS